MIRALPLLLLLALPACRNHRATSYAEDMKNVICACTEITCAEKGLTEFRTWFTEHMPQGTRDDAEEVSKAYQAAEDCARKLRLRAENQ